MTSSSGHLIRRWREHAGLTQGQMADAIGYERSYYSRVENGKRGYDQAILEKLAEVHGCKPTDLLSRDPELAGDLDAILRDLTPADLIRVTEIARTLRDVSQPAKASPAPAAATAPKAPKAPMKAARKRT